MNLSTIEQRHAASKAQGLIKEYGEFMNYVIAEMSREYDAPINKDTAEQVGLEYARRLAAKNALKLFIQKLNTLSNERN